MQEHPGVGAASEMGVHGLTPESGPSHANSPVITSQSLGPSSASAPHSPAPVTTAEAPTPLPVIEPAVTASTHAVANLAANHSAVPVAGPSRPAIPSLILPHIWQHTLILLPLRQSSRLQTSNAESSQAGASGGSNLERILSLERRMDTMERWKLEDDDWKTEAREYLWQLEERLKRADM
jgi:hypothetical protein